VEYSVTNYIYLYIHIYILIFTATRAEIDAAHTNTHERDMRVGVALLAIVTLAEDKTRSGYE
jgi:hypothetical protein